jgi:hypothetical protein
MDAPARHQRRESGDSIRNRTGKLIIGGARDAPHLKRRFHPYERADIDTHQIRDEAVGE